MIFTLDMLKKLLILKAVKVLYGVLFILGGAMKFKSSFKTVDMEPSDKSAETTLPVPTAEPGNESFVRYPVIHCFKEAVKTSFTELLGLTKPSMVFYLSGAIHFWRIFQWDIWFSSKVAQVVLYATAYLSGTKKILRVVAAAVLVALMAEQLGTDYLFYIIVTLVCTKCSVELLKELYHKIRGAYYMQQNTEKTMKKRINQTRLTSILQPTTVDDSWDPSDDDDCEDFCDFHCCDCDMYGRCCGQNDGVCDDIEEEV